MNNTNFHFHKETRNHLQAVPGHPSGHHSELFHEWEKKETPPRFYLSFIKKWRHLKKVFAGR